jgi:hypothetical protein
MKCKFIFNWKFNGMIWWNKQLLLNESLKLIYIIGVNYKFLTALPKFVF